MTRKRARRERIWRNKKRGDIRAVRWYSEWRLPDDKPPVERYRGARWRRLAQFRKGYRAYLAARVAEFQ